MVSFGDIACGVRAPLHLQLSVQHGPPVVRRGLVERSDNSAVFNGARCSAASANGRRRRHRPDLSSRGCDSGGRGRFSWKNDQYGRPPLRFFRESCFRETNRTYYTMTRAENDGNGSEETKYDHEDAVGPPITIKKYVMSANVDFYMQVVIFVLAAGFVDAGFSGDWSRIGVLSKQTEEELQMAAVGVVPLAATLIWSISQRTKKL